MRDFIITSLQTWDIEIGSTIKNTALEISKQNRVLYINTPMDISIRLRGNRQSPSYIRRMAVIKGETSPLRQINANMWVLDCPFMLFSANFLPAPLFNIVNRKNNARIARWIVEQAAALDFKNVGNPGTNEKHLTAAEFFSINRLFYHHLVKRHHKSSGGQPVNRWG